MAKKIFTDESLETLVDETKLYVDNAVSTKANSSHSHSISNVTNLQNTLDGKQATITGGATTIASSNLTANRALISNSSGKVAVSAVTSTELGYLDGVTSNVQTQLDGKSSSSHTHNYAGSSSAGGAATSANKLNTNAGSATKPVYFSNGIPVETTYSLNKTVPSDAKFTDTTYSVATQSANGLLSSEDKTQLDYGGIPIVTTAGDGSAYTATVDGMSSLKVGTKITIIPHVVSAAYAPTLNVNSLGAKAIRMPVTYNTSTSSNGVLTNWLAANKPVTVQYNGSYWITVDLPRPSAQYLYGAVPIANGGTGATTSAGALENLGAFSREEGNSLIEQIEGLQDDVTLSNQVTLLSNITSTDEQAIDISGYKHLVVRVTFSGGGYEEHYIDCQILKLRNETIRSFSNARPESNVYYGMASLKITPTSVTMFNTWKGSSITSIYYSVRGIN